MSEKFNHTDKYLFKKWQQETDNNSRQLNINEMEKLLKKASSDFSESIKKTIKIDMIFKLCLIAGLIILLLLFMKNTFVLITSSILVILGMIGLYEENVFLKGMRQVRLMERNIEDLIRDELKFYRSNLIRYPLVLSISIALFYVLGSMIYHAITYGHIKPINDITDVFVLSGLLLLGIIISISAHFPFFKSKINNLETLLNDLQSEESYKAREQEIRLKKKITLALFIIIGLAGILALIYIIIQL